MTLHGEPEEALHTDVYLEALLAAHARGRPLVGPRVAVDAPTRLEEAPPSAADAHVRSTARALDRRLVRFHPSFRFEEALASRLRTAAAMRLAERPAGDGSREGVPAVALREVDDEGEPAEGREALVPFPGRVEEGMVLPVLTDVHPRSRLLVSGAIASGVSLAGAALFAWRRTRPLSGAARAVQAARVPASGSSAARARFARVLGTRRGRLA